MLWLLFVLVLAALIGVPSVLIFRRGWRLHQADHYKTDGDGLILSGVIGSFVAFVLLCVVVGIGIDRHYSKVRCDQKNEVTGDRYVWMDYHYFGYECLLRTPSGNVTDTPVLPLEDVTQRSGG